MRAYIRQSLTVIVLSRGGESAADLAAQIPSNSRPSRVGWDVLGRYGADEVAHFGDVLGHHRGL
jgi:hypothetical protein